MAKLTPDYIEAINKWLYEERLSEREAAQLLGTSQGTINNWKLGKVDKINDIFHNKLSKYIEKYRNIEELRTEIYEETKNITNAFYVESDAFKTLKQFKDSQNLYVEQMQDEYKIPAKKILEWLELAESDIDRHQLSNHDAVLFMSMITRIMQTQQEHLWALKSLDNDKT